MSDLEKTTERFLRGELILIDKPLEWSSFDVVRKVRMGLQYRLRLKKIKVGHAGTLDPLASGLMMICTGRMTKEIDNYQAQQKEYLATVQLGATTPSYDLETDIDEHFPTQHITRELVEECLQQFRGELQQVPPVFSAIKVNGKRAYKKARAGKPLELEARSVTIHELELLHCTEQQLQLRVVCSKGTYIRSLAYDIGKALQSGAHLSALRRTAIGDYRVEQAQSVDEFINDVRACLSPAS